MEGRIFGYARVSATDQNLDRQLVELQKHVKEEYIVTDKASGKDLNRPGYQALKGRLGLREGDTLVVHSLDRLSRNKQQIKEELEWFSSHDIRLKVLDLPTTMIDVPEGQKWVMDMINNILIEVLASMAEQERLMIRKRQREGIDAAKAKEKYMGRPRLQYPDNWNEVMERYHNGQINATESMKRLGLKRTSFYKLLKKNQEK